MLPNAEALLFLPGASGNIHVWSRVSDRLAHPGRRYFLGWPGFGGLPSDPTVRGIQDLASRVIHSLNGPTAIFAQSMGGVVALLATLQAPALVTRLVLSVTSGGLDLPALSGVDWRPDFRANNPTLPTWFETERWDLSDRLHEIRAPTLLLWGDADPISPVAVGQRLRELLPNAELVVVSGASHDLVAERADEVLPAVERHLARALPDLPR